MKLQTILILLLASVSVTGQGIMLAGGTVAEEVPAEMITDGLIANYDGSSSYPGTGTIWYDLTVNDRDMTMINGVGYSSTDGGYMILDGVDDRLASSDYYLYDIGTKDFTLESWVSLADYPNNNNGNYASSIFSRDDAYSLRNWQFRLDGTSSSYDKVTFILFENNTTLDVFQVDYTFSLNTWYHIVVSRVNGMVGIYVNGAVVGSKLMDLNVQSSTIGLNIGSLGQRYFSQGLPLFLNGYISQIRFYNDKGLTSSEVLQNYNATNRY